MNKPAGPHGLGEPSDAGVGGRQRQAARLADLLDRSARGQESAFAELYDLTSSRIYGVVLKVLRSPDLSAEVTQEVYVEIWRQSSRYTPSRGSVMAWMTTIAHRRAVDKVRAAVSETRRDTDWARLDPDRPHDKVWDTLEHRLDAERVRKGMNSLTEVQREAVHLAYFGGYTHREVAGLLKLPLGTVKTRIRDGLIGLRDALGVEV
ncbi:MAG: ECF RNA polymerase sigma factor SigK [Microlunatus sp.]|nr:ECF RNA polymerase sigma factor SigK [Microlunatus sp.]MDN5770373.1 ECF RNA polymerase sigma factor SigK [Microlunatus sp.]